MHRGEPGVFLPKIDNGNPKIKNNLINLDVSRYDQNTLWGRFQYFWSVTKPTNLLWSNQDLDKAKNIVDRYKAGENLNISSDELYEAKEVYDSAFHPDTGEKLLLLGRMSAQVPMNMFITGSMLSFYKTRQAVIFWQWFNQSFNATVNYTNRSGADAISPKQLLGSYILATSSALGAALSFNHFTKRAPKLIQRFGPFVAVAAANCVNIPVVRSGEIINGTPVVNEHGDYLGHSTVAAIRGISMVVMSRILMAVPTMGAIPVFMDMLEKRGILKKYPFISTPTQVLLCGVILTFSTPFGCALFPQKSKIAVTDLEPELQERLMKVAGHTEYVYYNKGL